MTFPAASPFQEPPPDPGPIGRVNGVTGEELNLQVGQAFSLSASKANVATQPMTGVRYQFEIVSATASGSAAGVLSLGTYVTGFIVEEESALHMTLRRQLDVSGDVLDVGSAVEITTDGWRADQAGRVTVMAWVSSNEFSPVKVALLTVAVHGS